MNKIRLYGDYHTHTIFSSGTKGNLGRHATQTPEESAKKAYLMGLKELAITDHGLAHYMFGIKRSNLPVLRARIDKLNEEYNDKGLKILMGVEANLLDFNGTVDLDADIMNYLDIVLMGFHYGIKTKNFKEQMKLSILPQISKPFKKWHEEVTERVTDSYIKAIEKYPIKIITHPGDKIDVNIVRLAKACKEHGVALEINSSHKNLSVEDLIKIKDIDVGLYLGSDAHRLERVGDIKEALRRADEAQIDIKRIKNIYIE